MNLAALVALVVGSGSSAYAGSESRRTSLVADFRTSSGIHKLLVLDDDPGALHRLTSAGNIARSIDYGGFTLLLVDDGTLALLATDRDLRRVRVRDSFDLIGLNGWTIDTRSGEPADLPHERMVEPASAPWQFYVVQFVGPTRDEWIEDVTSAGDAYFVGYLPNNAHIVRATPAAWARLVRQAADPESAVQWVGVYHPAYRIAQALEPVTADASNTPIDVIVQVLDMPQAPADIARILDRALVVHDTGVVLANRRNVAVRVAGAVVTQLAHHPDVLWIEPRYEPAIADERQGQIMADNVTVLGGEEQPSGVGYWAWLVGRGLTCPFVSTGCANNGSYTGFHVDVTDTGLDKGLATDVPSPDFRAPKNVNQSRVVYARDYTGIGAADYNGHGTLVAATVGGYNLNTTVEFEDAAGYQYGLGIAPPTLLGSSKWLEPGKGSTAAFSTLVRDAYLSARSEGQARCRRSGDAHHRHGQPEGLRPDGPSR